MLRQTTWTEFAMESGISMAKAEPRVPSPASCPVKKMADMVTTTEMEKGKEAMTVAVAAEANKTLVSIESMAKCRKVLIIGVPRGDGGRPIGKRNKVPIVVPPTGEIKQSGKNV